MNTRSITKKGSISLDAVISGQLLQMYSNPFRPTNMKALTLSRIRNGMVMFSKESIQAGLEEMGMTVSTHVDNMRTAMEVLYQQYEARDLDKNITVKDFAEIFFKNKDHRVYKELLERLKLQCI